MAGLESSSDTIASLVQRSYTNPSKNLWSDMIATLDEAREIRRGYSKNGAQSTYSHVLITLRMCWCDDVVRLRREEYEIITKPSAEICANSGLLALLYLSSSDYILTYITSIIACRYEFALHIFHTTGSSDTARTILCATRFRDDGCNLYDNHILSISRWPS
jgi:hypothetical protein